MHEALYLLAVFVPVYYLALWIVLRRMYPAPVRGAEMSAEETVARQEHPAPRAGSLLGNHRRTDRELLSALDALEIRKEVIPFSGR